MEPEIHSNDQKPSNGLTEPLESLPNPTPPDAQDAKPQNRSKNESLLTLWWGECLWLLIACGLLVAIYLVLKRYNTETPPSWRFGLNLSTAVAIGATIIRVCLMGIVESSKKLVHSLLF
jgi:hypothetical protein